MKSKQQRERRRKWLALATIALCSGWIWLCLLPRLEQNNALRNDIQFLEEQGIDPSALYYTDLEVMDQLEAKVELAKARNPSAFWYPSKRAEK